MPKAQKLAAPESIGVKKVRTDELHPNPHNPRVLFDKAPMATLRGSIEKLGILVPLTVYREGASGKYFILDGQRRWTCARQLNRATVPVNVVAEPTLVQNIVTMFQIHKLREDWELMPTALKLQLLMDELGEKGEKALSDLTGLDPAVVQRCKKLLSYPRKFQDLMLNEDPENRVKADFFIELYPVKTDRTVTKLPWFKVNQFTQAMLDKYLDPDGGLKAVTDFRAMKQHIRNAVRAGKSRTLGRLLHEFVEDSSLSVDHLAIPSADVSAQARKIAQQVSKLEAQLTEMDAEEYYAEEGLFDGLERLVVVIRGILRKAGRRTT